MRFISNTTINNYDKRIFVVDNFYSDPYVVREYALQQEFISDLRYYKGKRSRKPLLPV